MDEQTRQKTFEPFFTTKEVGKGTGLGLALVYGTVKKHDGFITVASEPGKGATFRLYFPLTDKLPEKPAGPLDPSLGPGFLSEGTETILVAEDDEALRTLAVNVLENAGYEVIAARDGMEAMQKFREDKDRIVLALLDVIMPKKNGPEVYREIMAQAPGLKVIFMSGYTEGAFDLSDPQAKKAVFLQKPISPDEMLRRIRAELDQDKQFR
jgi:two-component system cell cycle sensor histidine kinase/response regulator CckA